jgi:ectoine hydroxylase-related dioxygenase (phytanoyl-CoA dioxygenase family)
MEGSKMRVRFKDEALDKQLEEDGYIVIKNWLTAEQVAKMKQVFDDYYQAPEFSTNLWNTLIMTDEEVRQKINDRLIETINPVLSKYFSDYFQPFGYFLTKPVDVAPREVGLHSDSSAVNEDKYGYLAIWLPLVDVTRSNGCMYMVPKSQKLFTYGQPFSMEWPYPKLVKSLKKYAVDLPMKAGDMLIFSGKTLHGSHPNHSKDPRPVVGTGLVRPDTEMLYYYYDTENNLVKTYEVEPFFYFRGEYSEPVGRYPLKGSYTFNPPEVSEKTIKQFYAKSTVKSKGILNFIRRLGIGS